MCTDVRPELSLMDKNVPWLAYSLSFESCPTDDVLSEWMVRASCYLPTYQYCVVVVFVFISSILCSQCTESTHMAVDSLICIII